MCQSSCQGYASCSSEYSGPPLESARPNRLHQWDAQPKPAVPELSTTHPHRSNRTVGAHIHITRSTHRRDYHRGPKSMEIRSGKKLDFLALFQTFPHSWLHPLFFNLLLAPTIPPSSFASPEIRSVFWDITFACLASVYPADLYSNPDPDI